MRNRKVKRVYLSKEDIIALGIDYDKLCEKGIYVWKNNQGSEMYGCQSPACTQCVRSGYDDLKACLDNHRKRKRVAKVDNPLFEEVVEEEEEVVEEEEEVVEEEQEVAEEEQEVAEEPSLTNLKYIRRIVDKATAPLYARIYRLECLVKEKKETVVLHSKGKGYCSRCQRNHDDNEKRLNPSMIKLTLMRKEHGYRDMDSKQFLKSIDNKKHCASCVKEINSEQRIKRKSQISWFDKDHKKEICMICRTNRAVKSTLACASCNVTKVQEDHASNKQTFINLFKTIKLVMFEIEEVEVYEEYSVLDTLAVDLVVVITDNKKKKYLLSIEVQATRKEDFKVYPHKMFETVNKEQPFRTAFINFNIGDNGTIYQTIEKLEVMRRWTMFFVRYGEHLPTLNMWWMFWGDGHPYAQNRENMSEFFRKPVKMNHGPKGIKSNWEFMTDPYMVDSATKSNAKAHPFTKINENLIDTNEVMFNNTVTNGETGPEHIVYSGGYNIDKDITLSSWKKVTCTIGGCDKCRIIT